MQAKSPTNIRIIDVSHWQGDIDFAKVRADGIQGVYIKATEGIGYADPMFKINATNASSTGLKIGFYHFAHANNDPTKEVDWFLTTIQGLSYDLPLVLDIESNKGLSKPQISTFADKWMQEMIRRTNRTPLLYTYTSFAKSCLDKSLNKYPVWIAHYSSDEKPGDNGVWEEWKIWQYSDAGKVSGIAGNVDLNDVEFDFWNEMIGGNKGPGMSTYNYNTIYKERVYANGGKLIHCEGNYQIKATDVRFLKFAQGKNRFSFVSEKGGKVSTITKREQADFGFNFPFFDPQSQLVVGTVWDGAQQKYINGAWGDMQNWYELGFKDGAATVGKFTKNQREQMDFTVQGKILIENRKAVWKNDGQRCQRTFIGIDANGDVLLGVADGRTKDDQGLTPEEIALYMQDKGAIWAIEGDGGGSTILATVNGGINQKENTGANERIVHHAVLVFVNRTTSTQLPASSGYRDTDVVTYGDLKKLGLVK